jgi:restriction endonuclease S subunit
MAEPLLRCPAHWLRATLEPDRKSDVIIHVESGGTPSTTDSENWDGDIPWLTPKEITGMIDGIYVSRTERMITKQGLENSAAKLLPVGAVMLTKRAPVGAVAINTVPMATNQDFLNFQCGPKLRPLYLAYWLKANKPYLDMVANGSTYPELYKSDLFEFEIAFPSLDEQDAILGVINSLQYIFLLGLPLEQSVSAPEEMVRIQEQSRHLRSVRDAILPLLLSGQLSVAKVKTKLLEAMEHVNHCPPNTLQNQQLSPSLWSQRTA